MTLRGGRAPGAWTIPSMESVAQEIAAAAARLVVEEGLEWGPAKRRALKVLGLGPRTA